MTRPCSQLIAVRRQLNHLNVLNKIKINFMVDYNLIKLNPTRRDGPSAFGLSRAVPLVADSRTTALLKVATRKKVRHRRVVGKAKK